MGKVFASMPMVAQSQYIETLLDFFDEEKRGANEVKSPLHL